MRTDTEISVHHTGDTTEHRGIPNRFTNSDQLIRTNEGILAVYQFNILEFV